MIKHADMMKKINKGETFSAIYCTFSKTRKKGGQLVEFTTLTKVQSTHRPSSATVTKAAKRRQGNTYTSLTPFRCADGSIIELHTRLFIKFNSEEVRL